MSVFSGILNVFDKSASTKQDVTRYNYRKGNYDFMNYYFNGIWCCVVAVCMIMGRCHG